MPGRAANHLSQNPDFSTRVELIPTADRRVFVPPPTILKAVKADIMQSQEEWRDVVRRWRPKWVNQMCGAI
jgi:hypothetical protein